MVQIEVEKNNAKRLMIDGCIPSFELLKKRLPDFRCTKDNPEGIILQRGSLGYYDVFQKYLGQSELSERQLSRLFYNTVFKLRDGFCPFLDPKHITGEMYLRRRRSCRYLTVVDHVGLGKGFLSRLRKRDSDICSVIEDEYAHQREKGHTRYIMNLILYNTKPEDNCGMLEECCANWINKLGFKVKGERDYKHHEEFQESMIELLYSLEAYLDLW